MAYVISDECVSCGTCEGECFFSGWRSISFGTWRMHPLPKCIAAISIPVNKDWVPKKALPSGNDSGWQRL